VREEQVSGSKLINSKSNLKDNKPRGRKEPSVNATNITKDITCLMCKEGHALMKCRKFQELPSWKRREQVRKARACFRCLGPNHSMTSCSSTIRYRYCQKEHYSLLYLGAGEFVSSQAHLNEPAITSAASKSVQMAQVTNMMTTTIGIVLATDRLISKTGESFSVRAFGSHIPLRKPPLSQRE